MQYVWRSIPNVDGAIHLPRVDDVIPIVVVPRYILSHRDTQT